MCGETRIPRDMCAGNTIPGETRIPVTPVARENMSKRCRHCRQFSARFPLSKFNCSGGVSLSILALLTPCEIRMFSNDLNIRGSTITCLFIYLSYVTTILCVNLAQVCYFDIPYGL